MNTAAGRDRWIRYREKKRFYRDIGITVKPWKPAEPLAHAGVRITRHSAGPEPDFDNLVQGGKFIFDALVRAGVIVDDKSERVVEREYLWRKVPRGRGFVEVEVWEVEDDGPERDRAA